MSAPRPAVTIHGLTISGEPQSLELHLPHIATLSGRARLIISGINVEQRESILRQFRWWALDAPPAVDLELEVHVRTATGAGITLSDGTDESLTVGNAYIAAKGNHP